MPFGCKSHSCPSVKHVVVVECSLAPPLACERRRAFTYAPSLDDPTFPAQQQGQIPFGSSDNFSFNQQYTNQDGPGSGILNQNDNSLLTDFFNNPGIANQMNFNFDPMTEGAGEDSKASATEGLFDLDNHSGTINNPATAFATQNFHYDGDRHTQSHSNSNSQRQSMSNQMAGSHESHEQSSEGAEEEEEKAAVEGLMGMSTNRPTPAQMMFGNMNGFGAGSAWGGINLNSPFLHMPNMQGPAFTGRQSAGPGAQNSQMGEHEQASESPFGYASSPASQYQLQQGFPVGMNMHMQQQAYAAQQRGRPQSMGNIRTDGITHLPSTEPRSAQLPNTGYPNFFTHFQNNVRPALNVPRYGSDENFGSGGYRPPNHYTPPDEKHANLNHVPLADEASVNSRSSRQPPMLPPNFPARAPSRQSQGYNSSSSQPTTPTFYQHLNNQAYLGGLPTTPNGTNMVPTSSFGSFAGAGFHGHAHPHAHGAAQANYYQQNMQAHSNAMMGHQGRDVEEPEDSSSEHDDTESDSPGPPQPARKRRKSNYEEDGEDDYQPPNGGKRRVQNSTLDVSSGEDEYGRPDSSKGNKRVRAHAMHRNSTTSYAASPPVRTPRPTSASGGKRNSRNKRMSGSTINRAPLTDEQRRQNHIKSEKNRRDLIKINYTELNNVIPALKGGKSGLSKSEVLREIVDFIEELEAGNEHMEKVLEHLTPGFQGTYDDGFTSSGDEGEGGAVRGNHGVPAY